MSPDVMATRSLWSAVRDNEAVKIEALLKRGANIHVLSERKAMGRGVQTARESLLDVAFEHRALNSLHTLLDHSARLHPTTQRGSEFTRACETATPWMAGIELLLSKRPALTAVSHPSAEYKPIHLALMHTGPLTEQANDLTHPLVDLLLKRPGKWTSSDTALAVNCCLLHGKDPGLLDRLEAAKVPVAKHLDATETQALTILWRNTGLNTLSQARWLNWWAALAERGVTPDQHADPQFIAAYRAHQGGHVVMSDRSRRRLRT